MSIEQDQITEWKRQKRSIIEEIDRHKATIKGNSLWPVSAESDERLSAELELTIATLKAEYDRLESFIQDAHSAPTI